MFLAVSLGPCLCTVLFTITSRSSLLGDHGEIIRPCGGLKLIAGSSGMELLGVEDTVGVAAQINR